MSEISSECENDSTFEMKVLCQEVSAEQLKKNLTKNLEDCETLNCVIQTQTMTAKYKVNVLVRRSLTE